MRLTLLSISIITMLAAFAVAVAQDKVPLPELNEELRLDLETTLAEQGKPPVEYVLEKIADHDVVVLGEMHRARQDPLLVQQLITRLPEAGVYSLCTEFARRVDQPLIDSLLNGTNYDQKLAETITLQQFPHWGYVEYVDIFKAAWRYNQSRAEGARPFRIFGINNSPEWWHVKTQEDRENVEVRRKVWHGEGEIDWANVVLDSVVAKGDKALCYCGIHHGFTEYRQPVVVDGEFVRYVEDRFGNHIYNAIGKRAITIYLHNTWASVGGYDKPSTYPADGYIDALMAALGPDAYPVGFDTRGSTFGKLPGKSSLYSHGYEGFTLEEFCDGYIFQMPFSEFEPVTCIEGYYTEDNIDYARRNAVNPWFRDQAIEEFEKSCETSRREQLDRWSRLR